MNSNTLFKQLQVKLYENVICLSLTISQALLFADTDSSLEAALSLLDQSVYNNLRYVTEYPLLTALARNKNPSENLINKFKTYLISKTNNFQPLNKLNLIYSSLVSSYCDNNRCTETQLVFCFFMNIFHKQFHYLFNFLNEIRTIGLRSFYKI